ncbi:RNA 2',3'-cyclic phosphodiesterase [Bdellovibrio sp. HCB185ZH]|uniref:RNA 2',3'-cyclic phosphodiesterase n=1 Tax=Bdellovibrio sp. HCB185ZH TaxID=3394235 RepID=UPI0039A55A88
MNKRLFFALNATDPLSTTFLPTYKKLKINADQKELVIKWVPPENFHITVSFLGETPEDSIPALSQALQDACEQTKPFDLKIDDISAFSSEHDARTLWLGVQNKKALGEFKDRLDEILKERNLLTFIDKRDFTPHLTIARLRNPKSVKDMISPFKRKSFGKIHVREIVLYESKLAGAFPVYKPIFRAKLNGKDQDENSVESEE